jgi:hypothetical protein
LELAQKWPPELSALAQMWPLLELSALAQMWPPLELRYLLGPASQQALWLQAGKRPAAN